MVIRVTDANGRDIRASAIASTTAAEGSRTTEEIVRAVNAHDDLVAALKECQAELYEITHSSGDPADATNMGSAAVVYRTVVAALTKAGA